MTAAELENWPVTEAPTDAEIGRVKRGATMLGGAVLQLPHSKRTTTFQVQQRFSASPRVSELASCGQIAQFTFPLDAQPSWQYKAGAGIPRDELTPVQEQANGVRLCAVDDAAHLWPRFS